MSAKKKSVVLPRKMSALITLALNDLIKVERSKKFVINMGDWHHAEPDGKCSVCFAGAVMAKTCKFSLEQNGDVRPNRHSMGENMDQFFALDSLRQGEVKLAASELSLDTVDGLDRDIASYHLDPKRFRSDMRKLASDLKKAGL
jgi:hypothetical protein